MSANSTAATIEILRYCTIYLNRYVLMIIYAISNIENILTASIFLKKHWQKNVCVFYFTICLIISFCYLNSIVVTSIFVSGFDLDLKNINVFFCKIYFYFIYVFLTLSPTILLLASIDRLLISSQNVDTRLYSSKRLAYFSVSVSTVFWMIFSIHTLIKVDIYEIHPSYTTCYYDVSSSYSTFLSYSSAAFVILFFTTMLILCIYTFKNVRHIRWVPRSQRREIRTMTKKDFQLLRCLFVYDLCFIVFCIPIIFVTVYQAIMKDRVQSELTQTISEFAFKTSLFLGHTPFCISFYIYVIVSKAFRAEVKRILYRLYCKQYIISREDDHK